MSVRHQFERHNTGHQNQDESRNHRHFFVVVDTVDGYHKLCSKSDEVQEENEALVQTLQPLSFASGLCWTDYLPGAGLGRLQASCITDLKVIVY